MWQWLRHAFAVNEEAPELTSEEANELESLATQVVRRGMATPAVTFLEMSRPLNYLGAQVLTSLAR
ncbi:MAG: hypothetical protein R3B90_09135 [Planctomycetaceae bacterium]